MLADLLNKCVQAFYRWGISHALRSVLSDDGMGSETENAAAHEKP